MLWARHHAWLCAPQEPPAGTAGKGGSSATPPPRRSRSEELDLDLASIAMPPVSAGEWLLAWLFEAGPLASDGMGARGLSWPELQAWRDCTQAHITPWEMGALRQLSTAYASAWHAAEKPSCPAYWVGPEMIAVDVQRSEAAGQAIKSIFGAMAKKHRPASARPT